MNPAANLTVKDVRDENETAHEEIDDAVLSDQSFNKNDSDIQIISVDSPEHDSNKRQTTVEGHESGGNGTEENIAEAGASQSIESDKITESVSSDVAEQKDTLTKSSSSAELVREDENSTKKETTDNSKESSNGSIASPSTSKTTQPSISESKPQMSNGTNPNNKKLTSSSDSETHLNQAAIKLLQRLEFKNPGRKQIEYGLFNPEESEREKKKLRRFQASKPRAGVCYKETGLLLDGRDICDCLAESCPGCFYPCPSCSSKKCGPTCRCNRKWVYDYIEDEGRTYRVEFPEQMNF